MSELETDRDIPYVFILSWERPIYLWVCLDSFYQSTKSPCRFVIGDNASRDPLVHQVIDGFERRGMFHAVHRYDTNDPRRLEGLVETHWDDIGEFFVFVEGDTAVLPRPNCWLQTLVERMKADPQIGSIGSRVFKRDFVKMNAARRLMPDLPEDDLQFLIKANAPMRNYKPVDEPLISPHCPPLRLLMLRRQAYEQVGFGRDVEIHKNIQATGWRSLISTEVVHRHLSLMNIYDYPDYGRAHRDSFFDQVLEPAQGGVAVPEPAPPPGKQPICDSRVICVLGMHRSGTSALTGTLEAAGLHLGNVVTRGRFNRKGSREDKRVMVLNEAVLEDNGGAWHRPPDQAVWTHERRLARDRIISSFDGHEMWGFKDPRFLFTVAGWQEVLPRIEFVGTIRNPVSVVKSLLNRPNSEGSEQELYELWRRYNEKLIELWEIHRFALVDFDAGPEKYLADLDAICRMLGLEPPKRQGVFFESVLRTNIFDGDVDDMDLPDGVKHTYRRLRQILSASGSRGDDTGAGSASRTTVWP
jgi:hypothetical protein